MNEDVEGVLGNGFAIKYLDGTNGDSLFKTEELSADGTYSIDVTMLKQWSRVKFYYKGEELDLVNEYKVTGAYSGSYITGRNLYSEGGNILYYASKDAPTFTFVLNPTTKTIEVK